MPLIVFVYLFPQVTMIRDKRRDKIRKRFEEIKDIQGFRELFIARIERYINGTSDSLVRVILQLRHIQGMSWNDIGKQIGYDGSTVRKKYERYLKVPQNSQSI